MEEPMFDVDFDLKGPKVICHEQYQSLVPKILEGLKPYNLDDHFVLFSSGTTGGDLKGYALSKAALFANAKAVNEHFELESSDVWGLSLPIYHIGGLSVLARAHLLKNKIVDVRHWDPLPWHKKMEDVTITTVVPTQLYDLVKLKLSPSKKLRYVVVGGDLLSSALKDEAMKLGWPVIRTFGMSEVCSQMASAKTPTSDELEILSIHKVKTEDERLLVKSDALFSLEFTLGSELRVTMASELCNNEGFYITKDKATTDGKTLKHLGRLGDDVKIAGHLVNLLHLKNELSAYLLKHGLFNQMEFAIEEDQRKGKKLVLITLVDLPSSAQVEIAQLISPVKIDEIRKITQFERTALGKLKKS
jgi:O-succinylbenzoic acid--CoA ligase